MIEKLTAKEAYTAMLPAAQVGDVTSDARGSGARYNGGKISIELLPLSLVAKIVEDWIDPHNTDEVAALEILHTLGKYQARQVDADALINTMRSAMALEECARVFDYGRKKYAEWNWAKGMAWSIPIACAARHCLAILGIPGFGTIGGELNDPESGLPHLGHAYCNLVMLHTFVTTYPEGDDRPRDGLLPKVR